MKTKGVIISLVFLVVGLYMVFTSYAQASAFDLTGLDALQSQGIDASAYIDMIGAIAPLIGLMQNPMTLIMFSLGFVFITGGGWYLVTSLVKE